AAVLQPRVIHQPLALPETEDHSTGLEEDDLVVGLHGPHPAQRFVEGARSRQVADPQGDQADALFHARMIARDALEGELGPPTSRPDARRSTHPLAAPRTAGRPG